MPRNEMNRLLCTYVHSHRYEYNAMHAYTHQHACLWCGFSGGVKVVEILIIY